MLCCDYFSGDLSPLEPGWDNKLIPNQKTIATAYGFWAQALRPYGLFLVWCRDLAFAKNLANSTNIYLVV
jgi:hypothetical protein